jgi:hypothetical protein
MPAGGMTTSIRSAALAAAATLGFAAACGSSNPCLSLAQSYADELPNALTCDTTEAEPCAAARNVVQYEQNGTQLTLEGLGTCLHSVNAAGTSKLDTILAAYQQAGCSFLPAPICTTPKDRCVQSADGKTFTCFP